MPIMQLSHQNLSLEDVFLKLTTVEPSEEKYQRVRIVMMPESQIMRIFPIADKMQKPKTATKARVIIWKYRRLIINDGYI